MARVIDDGPTAPMVAGAGAAAAADLPDALARQVLRALRGLRYGSVEITVHNGEVVQIERREKVRLERGAPRRTG